MTSQKRIKKVITEYDLITSVYDRAEGGLIKTRREYRETLELLNEENLREK